MRLVKAIIALHENDNIICTNAHNKQKLALCITYNQVTRWTSMLGNIQTTNPSSPDSHLCMLYCIHPLWYSICIKRPRVHGRQLQLQMY